MDDVNALKLAIDRDAGLRALLQEVAPRLDDDPGHDLQHCLRVALWAVRIGGVTVVARNAIAAALLHDVINLPKNAPNRAQASQMSADEARRLLPALGFSQADVEQIADAVRDHSFSRGAIPATPLGKALQDADRLEALGALGLCRTISTGTRMGARYFHADDPWARQRALDDRAFSVDHFFTKLFGLPQTMQTEMGKKEAQRRVAFLRAFLDQLADELGVPLAAQTEPA
ncbi:MAG: HD domain-containing protein [Deltaproteobacteria bacterium]|nr:HD domain-containing protein [Deltaproteobacteria bacterium]